MPVYLITGASRGLGYDYLKLLAQDSSNTVFGLVRNVTKTNERLHADNLQNNSNIHILQGDVTSHSSITAARTAIEKTTPYIDVLINNAGQLTASTAFTKLTDHEDNPEELVSELQAMMTVNVLGVVIVTNVFLPMILKSSIKKVIFMGSGLADDTITNKFNLYENAPYTISKAAVNTVVAKYNAAHGRGTEDRVLFLSISPGLVATGNDAAPPSDSSMPRKFKAAFPHFTGPITCEESFNLVMKVIDRASVDDEYFAGGFVSQFGNKQWL